MSSEILLVGSFTAEDNQLLKDVQNRLSLHTDSCVLLHREEYQFKLQAASAPGMTANTARYPMADGAPLRARRDLVTASTGANEWTLHTCQIANRMYKKATVRPFAAIPLQSGNALAFASALGYGLVKKSTRKGFLFSRGSTNISLYQMVESSPYANSAVWQLEVVHTVVVPPHTKNMQLPAASYIDNGVEFILSVAVIMKGLVDLVPPQT
ncbi:hypothetical protein M408DRAFT_18588 [Serendipita vermifera MAFF 305830]|uniref:Mediator of RNA polymerase II transcription subunit 18 n=1 Tax=Serendipita vermifera MAFF 305830 TaxID=933852 RepID=A0A0C3AK22_SERVB|nr:hypothetical protein M408DRAFT_18588 [Serendipita vermifera MAFF 305830]